MSDREISMETMNRKPRQGHIGNLELKIYPDAKAAAAELAHTVANVIIELAKRVENSAMIFATGVSQLEVLSALTAIPGLPWNRISGFHLDEYLGLPADHPASFRHYLRQHLTQIVQMRHFYEIDGTAADPASECLRYGDYLHACPPQLCLLGIGENGHLAFNDPEEANFEDPEDVKIVELDAISRRQQLNEGWFHTLAEVPERALTLTIPAIMRVPRLIVSAPGRRKAHIVKRMLEDPISTRCPATILRNHPSVTVYLDEDAAAELNSLPFDVVP